MDSFLLLVRKSETLWIIFIYSDQFCEHLPPLTSLWPMMWFLWSLHLVVFLLLVFLLLYKPHHQSPVGPLLILHTLPQRKTPPLEAVLSTLEMLWASMDVLVL